MNEQPKYEVFISYRRDGGVDYARMIYLELKGRGYNTFFDFNSLRSGKFNEGIFKAIDECRYFILVLSENALTRCMNEDDWVRHEIEYALSKSKEIIPVCPSGSTRGFPAEMPVSFEPLRNIQVSRLDMDDLFDKSFDKIVEDRFEEEFRKGRSPAGTLPGVTNKSFNKIGFCVVAAILVAAAAVTTAIFKLRKGTDDVTVAQIRAEVDEKLSKTVAAESHGSDVLKALHTKENEIKARLLPAKEEVGTLKKEIERIKNAGMYSVSTGEDANREEDDNRRAAKRSEEKLQALEKKVKNWEKELQIVQATIVRSEAIDKAYQAGKLSGLSKDELNATKKELDRYVARLTARRIKADEYKDQIAEEELLKARQLDEIAAAAKGSLVDALAKTKEADSAYGEILDKIIETKLDQIEKASNSLWDDAKWTLMLKTIKETVLPIDPENERIKKAIAEASSHASPSASFRIELDGKVVEKAKLYVDGTEVALPYKHSFTRGDDGATGKGTGRLVSIESVVAVYENGGKRYVAKKYGLKPNWGGEREIILRLKEELSSGTSVKIKLGRYNRSLENIGCKRSGELETPIEMIWCQGGSDVVKFTDPDTEKTKDVVRVSNLGYWISKTELTWRQYFAIKGKDSGNRGFGFRKPVTPKDVDLDMPYTQSYEWMCHDLINGGMVRIIQGTFLFDGMNFSIPTPAEWVHAVRYGGFIPTEDNFAEYAWCMENAGTNKMFHVGGKKGTKLGLHDVYGNVAEWVCGSALEWLGMKQPRPWQQVEACRFGGGCSDDCESSVNIVKKYASMDDKAGVRLIGRSMFDCEQSLVEWISVLDAFDSADEKNHGDAMKRLGNLAKSDDEELKDSACREYVARGGDLRSLGIELTASLRLTMVRNCKDQDALVKFVMEDADAGVRAAAFEKIDNPTSMVAAHYLAGIKGTRDRKNEIFSLLREYFVEFAPSGSNMTPKDGVDAKVFEYLALNALDADVRSKSLCGINDSQVLKKVALQDENLYVVYAAIEKIKDRTVLMEIRQATKKKAIRAAVRDRLEKLSE